MLINLSNHPSTTWTKEQLQAAQKQFGRVIDLPFPNIDPILNEENVHYLALRYMSKIDNLEMEVAPEVTSVHLMGEMTFTHHLVNLLTKYSKIDCYASTTKRDVTYDGDKKISTFKFIQFRKYI